MQQRIMPSQLFELLWMLLQCERKLPFHEISIIINTFFGLSTMSALQDENTASTRVESNSSAHN